MTRETLVIGGAGFIGQSVCAHLLREGAEVTVMGRHPSASDLVLPQCRYVSADLANRSQLRSLLRPNLDVINLAYSTVPKTSYGDPIFDLLSNLPATVGLLQEAMECGVHRLLLVSSGGTVYGNSCQLPIQEGHPKEPLSPYGITKLSIEHYAQMFHATMDLPVILARPANAYGPQQRFGTGQGFLAAAIHSIIAGNTIDIYGPQGTIRDYIHVDDVGAGLVSALRHGGLGGVYNLGTGVGHSNLDIVELLAGIAAADGFTVSTRHLPERRFDVDANVLDCSRLTQATGWLPQIPLTEGLASMWRSCLQMSSKASI